MKRYERLSKEEILKAYNSTLICSECILNSRCEADKSSCSYHVPCNERMRKYLTEELVPIPRWKTNKTNDDFIKMVSKYKESVGTFNVGGLISYLCEEIYDL